MTFNYFVIPSNKIQQPPQPPPYVWYAGWSVRRPTQGTKTQVGGTNQLPPPFVIGATTGALPDQATLIGKGPRSQFPAPPPFATPDVTPDYFASFQRWLDNGTDAQVCSYFSIPFAAVPAQPSYTTWFAIWSPSLPAVAPGWLAPMAIVADPGPVPDGGKFIVAMDKVPPPPPPVLAAPDTSLDTYKAWLLDRSA